MKWIVLLFLLAAGRPSSAQDLTGIWRGHFQSDQGGRMTDLPGMDDRYKFEVQLDQNDKLFKGVTYSYKTTVFYGKASCYGAINHQNKKVFLEETKIMEVKSAGGGACIMTCFLQYSKVGNEELLEGHYTSMSTADSSQCGKGTVFLRKVESSDFYKEPFLEHKEKPKAAAPKARVDNPAPAAKPAAPAKAPKQPAPLRPKVVEPTVSAPRKTDNLKTIPEDSIGRMLGHPNTPGIAVPQVLSARTNELVRTITTPARTITIKIYDNGTIDNDTVSVYVDKKLVVSKARLTEQAIEVHLSLNETQNVHELVMVAENLGEIPPNTSLMVVAAGDQQYEVRITSTEQKNALVLFKFEPKSP